jgi:hypothetical protein
MRAILAILILCSTSYAQMCFDAQGNRVPCGQQWTAPPVWPQNQQRAVIRTPSPVPWSDYRSVVHATARSGGASRPGSGVVIATANGYAYGLCSAHGVYDVGGQVEIRGYDYQATGKVLAFNRTIDVALFEFRHPHKRIYKIINIAKQSPPEGTMLYAVGRGGNGLLGSQGVKQGDTTAGELTFGGRVIEGMSGGLIHDGTAMVGIITIGEEQGRFSGGPRIELIRQWLQSTRWAFVLGGDGPDIHPRPDLPIPPPPIDPPAPYQPPPDNAFREYVTKNNRAIDDINGHWSNTTDRVEALERRVIRCEELVPVVEDHERRIAILEGKCGNCDIDVDSLVREVLSRLPDAQAGPPGPPGPPGSVDVDAIVAEVLRRIPTPDDGNLQRRIAEIEEALNKGLTIQVIEGGKVYEQDTYFMGDTVPLNLVPYDKWAEEHKK